MHLEAEIPVQPPVTNLHTLPVKEFTYALYPTAATGENGMVPGNTASGVPMMLRVRGGSYDHHLDPNPIEFDVTNSEIATRLEHAPGQIALLVYGVLYTGAGSSNCTGVVDELELKKGHLILQDQISYDCRGGGNAEYDNGSHHLTVRSARYSAGDQPCCPSSFDVVELHLNGDTIRASDVSTID